MTARRLVLTADDFGYDRDSAALVLDLIDKGALTATTVLAVAPDLRRDQVDALASLAADGRCAVGLHFTTNSDGGREPWSPLSHAGRRLAEPDGHLPTAPGVAERRADADVAAIHDELEAQHARLRALGLAPVRVDSHAGTIYGFHSRSRSLGSAGAVLAFCARRGLGLRIPRSLRLSIGWAAPPAFRQRQRVAVRMADDLGVRLPQEMITDPIPAQSLRSYAALRRQYLWLLRRVPAGTSELYVHPGADTPWARRRFGRSWDKRVWEAQLLRDPVWRRALDSEGIELVTTW